MEMEMELEATPAGDSLSQLITLFSHPCTGHNSLEFQG